MILWGIAIIFIVAFWERVIPPQQFNNGDFWEVFTENYIWFVLIIYGVFLWGILEATKLLVDINFENDISESCKYKFKNFSDFFESQPMALEQIRTITQYEDHPNLRTVNLYTTIIEAAENRRFDSPLFAVQRFTEEFVDETAQLSSIQRLALQLGILGTFLGLIKAFSELYGKETRELSTNVIIEALSFSFGSSVAGLECAIFLGIFSTVILKKKHKKLFENLNTSAGYLVYLCHKAQKRAGKAYDENQLAKAVSDQTRDITSQISSQNNLISQQNSAVNEGLTKLIESKNEFDLFLKDISNDLLNIYQSISPESFSKEVSKNLGIATTHIVEKVDSHFENINQSYQNLGNLDDIIRKMNSQLADTLQMNNELVSKSKTEIFETLSAISKELQTASGSNIREELILSIDKIGNQMTINNTHEMQLIREELNNLQTQLSGFNKTFSAEVENKKPVRVLLEMGALSLQLVKGVIFGTIDLVKNLFKQIFK